MRIRLELTKFAIHGRINAEQRARLLEIRPAARRSERKLGAWRRAQIRAAGVIVSLDVRSPSSITAPPPCVEGSRATAPAAIAKSATLSQSTTWGEPALAMVRPAGALLATKIAAPAPRTQP
jgi:hypothetical protein